MLFCLVSVYPKGVFLLKRFFIWRDEMKFEHIFAFFMLIAVVSFLGFAVENLWMAATKGYMDNRNMTLPFLLGYGLAVAALFLLFGTPGKMRLGSYILPFKSKAVSVFFYFLAVMLCISVGEIVLGTLVEKVCGIVWWDYTDLPLHITKYTSLFTSMGFTAIIVLFMEFAATALFRFFSSWNIVGLGICSCTLMLLMTVDFVHSAYLMYRDKKLLLTRVRETKKNRVYRALHGI